MFGVEEIKAPLGQGFAGGGWGGGTDLSKSEEVG